MTSHRNKPHSRGDRAGFPDGFCPLGYFPSFSKCSTGCGKVPFTNRQTLSPFSDSCSTGYKLGWPSRISEEYMLCFLKGKRFHPLQLYFPVLHSALLIISIHLNSGNHKSSAFKLPIKSKNPIATTVFASVKTKQINFP